MKLLRQVTVRYRAWRRARHRAWLRRLTRMRVGDLPESERVNWRGSQTNWQAEDTQKMRGHLSR